MLLCLALQILQCQCKFRRCKFRKHSVEISNGLRARSAGPDLTARAHSAGPGALDRGPLAKEPSAERRDPHGGNIAPKWLQKGFKMEPVWLPNWPWRPLGGLLGPLKRLGRPRGGFQGLMGRSWMPLGSLLGPKKEVLNGSWPLQEEFQDRFQPSWGPKGSQKGGREGAKSSPRGNSS